MPRRHTCQLSNVRLTGLTLGEPYILPHMNNNIINSPRVQKKVGGMAAMTNDDGEFLLSKSLLMPCIDKGKNEPIL